MSRGTYASDKAPHWSDEIEAYANRGQEKDPDVEQYLRHVSTNNVAAEVLRTWNGTGTINRIVFHSSSSLDAAMTNVVVHIRDGSTTRKKLAPLEVKTSYGRGRERGSASGSQSPVGRTHRWMWLVLTILSAIWGGVAGASIFSGTGVSPGLALFGFLGNVVLALSLFKLSAAADWSDR